MRHRRGLAGLARRVEEEERRRGVDSGSWQGCGLLLWADRAPEGVDIEIIKQVYASFLILGMNFAEGTGAGGYDPADKLTAIRLPSRILAKADALLGRGKVAQAGVLLDYHGDEWREYYRLFDGPPAWRLGASIAQLEVERRDQWVRMLNGRAWPARSEYSGRLNRAFGGASDAAAVEDRRPGRPGRGD